MKVATQRQVQSPPTVVATPDILQACDEVRDINQQLAALDAMKRARVAAIKEHMGDARQLLNAERTRVLATMVESDVGVFDKEGFAIDHPRLLKQYTRNEQRLALRVR